MFKNEHMTFKVIILQVKHLLLLKTGYHLNSYKNLDGKNRDDKHLLKVCLI